MGFAILYLIVSFMTLGIAFKIALWHLHPRLDTFSVAIWGVNLGIATCILIHQLMQGLRGEA
jgi:hypothetical protein